MQRWAQPAIECSPSISQVWVALHGFTHNILVSIWKMDYEIKYFIDKDYY